MKLQKWFMSGACVFALGAMVACSSDDGEKEDNPIGVQGGDEPMSSVNGEVTPASSSTGSAPLSSETGTAVVEPDVDDGQNHVRITEIMYNAPDQSALEWVELTISSGKDINSMKLLGLRLDGAVTYEFPAEPLKVGEYIVVTNDVDLFKQTYPTFAGRVFGPWDVDPKTGVTAKLANEGDAIDVKLTGKDNTETAAFGCEPPWASLANGKGSSLVFKGGNPALPTAWGASKQKLGNPGAGPDEYVTSANVRLNEIKPFVLADNEPGWIEFYNASDVDADISGWEFESKLKKAKWTISAANAVVPAKGFLVLDAIAANFGDDLYLSDKGGEFYLYEVVGGEKTGVESSLMLPATSGTAGVVEISDGSIAQGALQTETKGTKNSALKVGPVFINELHYHPKEGDANDVEFLELVNKGTEDVTLYFSDGGASQGWKIEGIRKEFVGTDILPAGGMMVLFPDSLSRVAGLGEDGLRTRYSIDASVKIGFYEGRLSNRGETVAVKQPFAHAPREDGVGNQWYYDWSDATLYSDKWPGTDFNKTDGFGLSLQRVDFATMGYEASAWKAAAPTPGK